MSVLQTHQKHNSQHVLGEFSPDIFWKTTIFVNLTNHRNDMRMNNINVHQHDISLTLTLIREELLNRRKL